MKRLLSRTMTSVLLASAAALMSIAPERAMARELAVAQGPIAIHAAAAGQRAPSCGELVVEARDALDNHLIGLTHPESGADGACSYALSVPAQGAVWLRVRPVLVAGARIVPDGAGGTVIASSAGAAPSAGAALPAAAPSAGAAESAAFASGRRAQGRGVQIRFTVIAPATYFFAPGEQKTVPLSY